MTSKPKHASPIGPKKEKKSLPIIGWKEVIDLPEHNISNLLAKIDTGAKTSALDVSKVRQLNDSEVEFEIVGSRKDKSLTQSVCCAFSGKTTIRSSNGQIQTRYRIKTTVQVGNKGFPIEFTLVSRKSMICRVLIGRKALENRFLVDPSVKYVHRSRKKVRVK